MKKIRAYLATIALTVAIVLGISMGTAYATTPVAQLNFDGTTGYFQIVGPSNSTYVDYFHIGLVNYQSIDAFEAVLTGPGGFYEQTGVVYLQYGEGQNWYVYAYKYMPAGLYCSHIIMYGVAEWSPGCFYVLP